jgi:magnesium transporter
MTLEERLLRRLASQHPDEAAILLGEQGPEDAAAVLVRLPEGDGAAVLARTAPPAAAAALTRLDPGLASELVGALPVARAAALLRHLEPDTRERLLATLPRAERLRSLIAYPPGTAGALMDPSVLALPAHLELDEARRRLGELSRSLALDLYLVDTQHRLQGVADLRQVLDTSRTGTLELLGRTVDPIRDHADLASLVARPAWLHHDTLPVVDDRGTYLGAVRAERLRQVAYDEAERRSRGGADAVVALGELFWLGLSGLLSSLSRPRAEEAP